MHFVKRVVDLFWPLHKAFYSHSSKAIIQKLRSHFLYWSPVVDYHYAYPQLDEQRLFEWAVLDTHDTLTDRYKHFRSVEEIRAALHSFGMINIQTAYAGNGVEARAWKPER